MWKCFFEKVVLALLISIVSLYAYGGAGDDWTRVRGDASPGVTYDALVETSTGRLIAAGNGGQLMISDNGGSNWRYDVIRVNGQPLFGRVSDLIRRGSQIIGIVNSVVPSNNQFGLPFEGFTQIVTSTDNGNSWQLNDFPHRSASFVGHDMPGVFLEHLHLSNAGELLAYGTVMLAAPPVFWSIGGAVFRNVGGNGWEQTFYQLGALDSMSDANGRLVAAGFRTVIDSADGAGWNGYPFDDAELKISGQPLDADILRRLAATDITWQNGNYVMQTQAYKPLAGRPDILTTNVDHTYTFRSANPFDGGRTWEGVEHSRMYPFFLPMNNRILSMLGAIHSTSNSGQSWSMVNADAGQFTRSYSRVGSNSAVAVRSSERVWRSDDSGASWNKVFDLPDIPSIQMGVRAGNILYGLHYYTHSGSNYVFRSLDNGLTWTQIADVNEQTGNTIWDLHEHDGVLFGWQSSDTMAVSNDGGFTWESRALPIGNDETINAIITQPSGRLIGLPKSKSTRNLAAFHYSDDSGQSWQRGGEVPLQWYKAIRYGTGLSSGRIICLYNEFGDYQPVLFISDDNGLNWRREDPFTGLAGLRDQGGPERYIELMSVFETDTGRVIILGDSGEILTSDDRGDTWVVRRSLYQEGLDDGDFFYGDLMEVVQVGDRLVIVGAGRDLWSSFAMISEDDGTTWRKVEIKTRIGQTGLGTAMVGLDGRLIFSGNNGAVYVSDSIVKPMPEAAHKTVREGETVTINVPRPPAVGIVTARYNATGLEAVEGVNFQALAGTLAWTADDNAPKSIVLQTLEDGIAEGDKNLTVDVHIGTDGSNSNAAAGIMARTGTMARTATPQLILDTSYLIVIQDNESTGKAGIALLPDGPLETTEAGGTAVFRLVLTKPPTSDVVLDLTNGAPDQISLSVHSLTFTSSNWNQPQSITATGLDNDVYDRNVAVRIKVVSTSNDTAYADLPPLSVYVTNIDDDADDAIFADGFEAK